MIYKLYLEEDIKSANCEVLNHLTSETLVLLSDDWSDGKKMQTIENVYQELSDPRHPVSVAMAKMQEVPEIKIIEGKT